jgi:hypothetical protein
MMTLIHINIFMKMALIQVRLFLIQPRYLLLLNNSLYLDTPMDPQDLMYLCSIADHSASQRILVKSARPLYNHHFTLSTPELGQSPTDIPQAPRERYQINTLCISYCMCSNK